MRIPIEVLFASYTYTSVLHGYGEQEPQIYLGHILDHTLSSCSPNFVAMATKVGRGRI